jgi:hypothetical protein
MHDIGWAYRPEIAELIDGNNTHPVGDPRLQTGDAEAGGRGRKQARAERAWIEFREG